MVWEKKEIDQQEVKKIAKQFDLDALTCSILARRNVTEPGSICYFIENDIRFLHSPFLFSDMEEAVSRIMAAVESGEKIFVFGDRDVDGITSIVLLVRTLNSLGADVSWDLPCGDDDYGLTSSVINKIKGLGIQLLITVDCGISNIHEIEAARENGIDTIIVDHHNPHPEVPNALAIINPKMKDSGYPFKDLSGCAVASKLVWALAFSKTSFYGKEVVLLHVQPNNESYSIECVKMQNCVEQERVFESIIPGALTLARTRLSGLVTGVEVVVYDKELEAKSLAKVFGPSHGIELFDIAPYIAKEFPALAGKSLLAIKEKSRIAKYSNGQFKEMDVLTNLFISFVLKSEPTLSDAFVAELDIVALGTLADIMPLLDENRILVKLGLRVLNEGKRPGLRRLVWKTDLQTKIVDAKDVSWYITPVINASGRMGEPDKAAKIFLSDDEEEVARLVDHVIGLNEKRKLLGESAWQSVIESAKTSFEKSENKFVLVSGSNVQRGITGILASRLTKYFKVPAIAVALLESRAVGSLRSNGAVNARDFLHTFSDIFSDFGGHDLAGGFTMPVNSFSDFEARFYESVQSMETAASTEEKIQIDAELPLKYLEPGIWNVVEFFSPYGEANPPLVFLTRNLVVLSAELIGKKDQSHLKLILDAGKHKWPAIIWNGADRYKRDFNVKDSVDVVYNITKNNFQSSEVLQLHVIDIAKSNGSHAARSMPEESNA
jgi:single-stranded-DNA-specific exonuclease